MSHASQKRNARIKGACAAFLKRESYVAKFISVDRGAYDRWLMYVYARTLFYWEGDILKTHLPNEGLVAIWNRIAAELNLPLKVTSAKNDHVKIRTPWGTRRFPYAFWPVADLLDPNYDT